MISVFVNPTTRGAAATMRALAGDRRFLTRELDAAHVELAVRAAVRRGEPRVLVAGGDGTIAAAAGAAAGSDTALGVLPAGTLNHFARDFGIPTDPRAAIELAAAGEPRRIDVGHANERVFLNTSAVGVYVGYVRRRDRLQPRLGYLAASAVASVGMLTRLRSATVTLEADGETVRHRTPLLFVGVHEREVRAPAFGSRVAGGGEALHLVVVRTSARARLLTLAIAAAARGLRGAARTPHVDALLVEGCTIELPQAEAWVALDGEVVRLRSPVEYRLARAALAVVAPPPAAREPAA